MIGKEQLPRQFLAVKDDDEDFIAITNPYEVFKKVKTIG